MAVILARELHSSVTKCACGLVLHVLGMAVETAQIFATQANARSITAIGIFQMVDAVPPPPLAPPPLFAAITRTARRAGAKAVHGLTTVAGWFARTSILINSCARKVNSVLIITAT